jgi:flagellum-specific peptidoglycan hydrolase FlgJ
MANIDAIIKGQALKMGLNETLAKLIVGQARYETNDYKSNVFLNLNNAFGYKYVGQKKWPIGGGTGAPASDAQGNPDGGTYAKYKNVADSTGELVDWIKRKEAQGYFKIADIKTPEQYAAALKNASYYGQTATTYAKGITAKLNNIFIASGGGIAILLIVAGFFFLSKRKKK